MLDELSTIINSFSSSDVFSILSFPNSVLVVSGGLFLSLGLFVLFDISNGLSNINFSLFKSSLRIISKDGVGSNLSFVIVNVVGEVNSDSITSSLSSSVDCIVLLLVFIESSNDSVQ